MVLKAWGGLGFPSSHRPTDMPGQPRQPLRLREQDTLLSGAQQCPWLPSLCLCQAGSCPLPHFPYAGVDPNLHPGSLAGPSRRMRLSFCSLLREEYWGPYLFKKIFKQKRSADLYVSPPYCCPLPFCPLLEDILPDSSDPALPGWPPRTHTVCGAGAWDPARSSFPFRWYRCFHLRVPPTPAPLRPPHRRIPVPGRLCRPHR